MRRLGYPADKINILTNCTSQKKILIRKFKKNLSKNPSHGMPRKIDTISNYYGEQNDHVLVSIKTTENIQNLITDRLTKLISSSRLTLYILGRKTDFIKLTNTSKLLKKLFCRPSLLCLAPPTSNVERTHINYLTMTKVSRFGQFHRFPKNSET